MYTTEGERTYKVNNRIALVKSAEYKKSHYTTEQSDIYQSHDKQRITNTTSHLLLLNKHLHLYYQEI